MSKNPKAKLPIVQRIRRQRRLPEYYQVVEGLKQCNIILYAEEFFQLGRGSFGKCYLGKMVRNPNEDIEKYDRNELIRNGELIAVKVMPKSALKTTLQSYRHEVQMLHRLTSQTKVNSENLVKLIIDKGIESDKNYYLVTEYCNNCTLFDLIQNRRQEKRLFTLWEFIQLALDLVQGYLAMRSHNIMHNDLKPQNIFIKNKVFKIGDFGLSLRLSTEGQVPCGTLLYCAPEKLQQKAERRDIDHKADIYALGLILHEVLYGCHPYWEEESYEKFKHEAKTKLRSMGREPSSEKEQKRLKKSIFLKYLKQNSYKERKVQLQPVPGDQSQHAALTRQLQKLVCDMCHQDRQKRITLVLIKDLMERLALRGRINRDDLFPDLQKLSQSELRFQMANMSKMAVDNVQINSIRFSERMKGTQAIDVKLVGKLKQRLFVIFDYFRLLRTLREQVQGEIQGTVGLGHYLSPSFPQIFTNYLYAINRRELELASQRLLIMSPEELRVATRQDIPTDLRQLKLNDEELFKDAQIDLQTEFEVQRKVLLEFIKERLRNELITVQNWSEILAWVLLYTVVQIEQKHQKSQDRDEMGQELARIDGKLNLFKLQAVSGDDWLIGKEILDENQKNFTYFYEINDE